MARLLRAEVEGGLYHLIARGNNRQVIFHDTEDFKKFLSLLSIQKAKLGFYLYAFCLMSNHIHLLIERQAEPIGRIMLRVLTGYSANTKIANTERLVISSKAVTNRYSIEIIRSSDMIGRKQS